MIFTYFTMMIGVFISFISAYYSVVGLANIFSGSFWSIIIMASALEVGKITATLWLHRYWDQGRWWLKTYLSIAVVVLMFITSMGIFGGLSKAHIEQTGASQESIAQIERYDSEVKRQTGLVERYESRIKQLESGGGGADSSIQSQIDTEQKRIDSSYSRIQPQIDEQNKIIEGQSRLFSDQITKIDGDLALLQRYIDGNEVTKAQALVGVKTDGDWGPGTAKAVNTWRTTKTTERSVLVSKIQDINRDNSNIQAAREEIKRLRATVDVQVTESNKTIARLRESLGKNTSEDIDSQLKEQLSLLKDARTAIDEATKQKYILQTEYRKLEAEVGPVKYIAEFIYGEDADKDMLERAVRWVIITIIFVFDPLAVLLLLASQYSLKYHNRERKQSKDNSNEPSEIVSVNESQTTPLPNIIFDKDSLTEIDNILTQEFERLRESEESLANKFENEQQKNTTLQIYSERLETELKMIQSDRDKLFKAHSVEMERADRSDQLLEEMRNSDRRNLYELLEILEEMRNSDRKRKRKSLDELLAETPEDVSTTEGFSMVDDDIATTSTTEIAPNIVTENVTTETVMYHPMDGYVKYDGKLISVDALKTLRPDLILSDNNPVTQIMFGSKFPQIAKTGDIYIRIDVMPHIVFEFSDQKWIILDKKLNNLYIKYIPYIQYLIQKIESGEYDAELLTDDERDEISNHLKSK